MLSHEIESQTIHLLLEIANSDKNINSLKHSIIESTNINPIHLFFSLDKSHSSKITLEDIMTFLQQFNITSSIQEIQTIILFYDLDGDGTLNFKEFLNLIISDTDYVFKKMIKQEYKQISKAQISSQPYYESNLSALADILKHEIDFIKYITTLINNLKNNSDFNLQDIFYSIKSYSYITSESIKAFFDKNKINYSIYDIKSIFNRLDYNKDGKISFNDLKIFFNLDSYNNNATKNEMTSSKGMNAYQLKRSNRITNNNEKKPHHHKYEMKQIYLKNNIDFNKSGNYQFECMHLSRNGSPVHLNSKKDNSIQASPIINPPIQDGRNNPYKIFHREFRENNLNKSKNKSLSRNCEYQSPGNGNNLKNSLAINYQTNINKYTYKKDNNYLGGKQWKNIRPVTRINKTIVLRKIGIRNKSDVKNREINHGVKMNNITTNNTQYNSNNISYINNNTNYIPLNNNHNHSSNYNNSEKDNSNLTSFNKYSQYMNNIKNIRGVHSTSLKNRKVNYTYEIRKPKE